MPVRVDLTSQSKSNPLLSSIDPLKIIKDAGKMDLVSWGVTTSAFVKRDLDKEALFLFNLFRVDCPEKPDEFILGTKS